MLGKQGIKQLTIAVGARQADIVFTVEIGRSQLLLAGKRVALRQHADLVER
jgi:hypothetical protein